MFQGHQLDLTQHVGVRLERDSFRIPRHPELGAEVRQCRSEPCQVGIIGRGADVYVHGGMPGVVEPDRHPTDDHELHTVVDEHTTDGCHVLITQLRRHRWPAGSPVLSAAPWLPRPESAPTRRAPHRPSPVGSAGGADLLV